MDVCNDSHPVHLPAEVVDHVCDFAAGQSSDLCALRLVCRALNSRATQLLTESCNSPSELFTHFQGDMSHKQAQSEIERKLVTIWTEIRILEPIEDGSTPAGTGFHWHLHQPDTASATINLPVAIQGRKAVCWGRVLERPEIVWIIHRKRSETHRKSKTA